MFHRQRNPGTKIARKVKPTRRPVNADVEISGFCMRFTTSGAVAPVASVPVDAVVLAAVSAVVASCLGSAATADTASRAATRTKVRRDIPACRVNRWYWCQVR